MTWQVSVDPDDKGRRLFLHVGGNLGPDPGGLAYSIRENTSGKVPAPCVYWHEGRIEMGADEVLAKEADAERATSAISEAVEWLKQELADGPKPAKATEEKAVAEGISKATLKNARKRLKIVAVQVRSGKRIASWYWALPDTDSVKE